MTGRLLLCVGMGVFVAHLGVFMILDHLKPKPPRPPENTFKVRSQLVVDHDSGEKTVYREITVSTRLGAPAPKATPAPPPVLVEVVNP
ncbi:MAG: hypothetical protein WCF18_10815 [Chthoniobacteraceae bacterium]